MSKIEIQAANRLKSTQVMAADEKPNPKLVARAKAAVALLKAGIDMNVKPMPDKDKKDEVVYRFARGYGILLDSTKLTKLSALLKQKIDGYPVGMCFVPVGPTIVNVVFYIDASGSKDAGDEDADFIADDYEG